MRIKQILIEADENKERRSRLKQEIDAGKKPIIHNASYVSDQSVYTMGDLQALKWMTKRHLFDGNEIEGWERTYTGPKPVTVRTQGAEDKVIKTGDVV